MVGAIEIETRGWRGEDGASQRGSTTGSHGNKVVSAFVVKRLPQASSGLVLETPAQRVAPRAAPR